MHDRLPSIVFVSLLVTGLVTTPLFADAIPANAANRAASFERHLALDAASDFSGLAWRNIGPVVQGGRVVDIEAVPGKPYSFLVAYASGGLWRTDDNGLNFEPIFDDQPTLIMGDVAIDPSNADRVWVGTGENNSSRSSYGGDGVFRSDDGGDTWTHVGLGDSDRIGRILVDPRDGDRVYVGVLGKLYTTGGERGLFRTTDGGDTWQQILAPDGEWTGVIDLVMHPENPDVLFAATWERSRRPWNFVEGGNGSGVYKTTDGGDTWTRLDGGFPGGEHVGRIGLTISASSPDVLYASVDHQEPLPEEQWDLGDSPLSAKRMRSMTKEDFLGFSESTIEAFIRGNDLDTSLDAASLIEMIENDEVTIDDLLAELSDANANLFDTDIRGLEVYRSDDGGKTWTRTHEDPLRGVVFTYGYYFGQIRVDPTNPDKVFVLGVPMIVTEDGGKTWNHANQRDIHVDYQALWIDPKHPNRVLVGNDGGLDASWDGGKTWVKVDAQPVGQFYAIEVDMAEPYNVYGGLQDNGTLMGSSTSRPAIDAWREVGGGDGMHIEVDPRDGTFYAGFQFGFYFRSDGQQVRPRDALKEPALRYNWQTPIRLSSHNSDVLYYGAHKLYRSMDRGETWTAISDDLTTATERGDVPFATLATLSESTERFGLIWAGTDDGNVWVTDDGGVEWQAVKAGLPADRWVSRVEASRHEVERAYVTLNGYREDDLAAYVYVTEDLGKTWTSIAGGLPSEAVNVIREDPVNEDVLYVGTDRGVYVSLDRGATWQGLPNGLPNVPVHDLVVHPRDRELVAGTHGRSIYVVDVLPVQELAAVRDDAVHVFPVESVGYDRVIRGETPEWFPFWAEGPEVAIPFYTQAGGDATLTILDGDERELYAMELADLGPGVHTFTWDLSLDEKKALAAEEDANATAEDDEADATADEAPEKGWRADWPRKEAVRLGWPLYATPGSYTLRVTVGDDSADTDFSVDPATPFEPRQAPEPKIRGQRDDD
ncbi:MAG: glycosyl hydrolase [Acidobacteriota bacterium]